jgi:hypothetical protein
MDNEVRWWRLIKGEVPGCGIVVLGCIVEARIFSSKILERDTIYVPVRLHIGECRAWLCVDTCFGFEVLASEERPSLIYTRRVELTLNRV